VRVEAGQPRGAGANRTKLLTLSEAKAAMREVQRQRAGEAGLLRIQRENEWLAAAYPVPSPRPPWEAQPQKQGPQRDDRLRNGFQMAVA
jgi:hypothetical protein